MSLEESVRDVYRRLIDGWNANDAGAMAAAVASEGLVIGFDGSQMSGRGEVRDELPGDAVARWRLERPA